MLQAVKKDIGAVSAFDGELQAHDWNYRTMSAAAFFRGHYHQLMYEHLARLTDQHHRLFRAYEALYGQNTRNGALSLKQFESIRVEVLSFAAPKSEPIAEGLLADLRMCDRDLETHNWNYAHLSNKEERELGEATHLSLRHRIDLSARHAALYYIWKAFREHQDVITRKELERFRQLLGLT